MLKVQMRKYFEQILKTGKGTFCLKTLITFDALKQKLFNCLRNLSEMTEKILLTFCSISIRMFRLVY